MIPPELLAQHKWSFSWQEAFFLNTGFFAEQPGVFSISRIASADGKSVQK